MGCVVVESFTISSPCSECIGSEVSIGSCGPGHDAEWYPRVKDPRSEHEKEWTECWSATDQHSVMFNNVTPAELVSLCVNPEALYALVLLLNLSFEVQPTRSMIVWNPWFHQKEIYLSIHQAVVFGLSLKDGWESLCSNMTDDYTRFLMLCLWLSTLERQFYLIVGGTGFHLYSIRTIKNAEKISASGGTFSESTTGMFEEKQITAVVRLLCASISFLGVAFTSVAIFPVPNLKLE